MYQLLYGKRDSVDMIHEPDMGDDSSQDNVILYID